MLILEFTLAHSDQANAVLRWLYRKTTVLRIGNVKM